MASQSLLVVALIACSSLIALASAGAAGRRPGAHLRGAHCGSGWSSYFVPDSLGTLSMCDKRPTFGPSCKIHDSCYDTCGKTQEICDSEFLAHMVQSCKDQKQTGWCASYCTTLASAYYQAVASWGEAAFSDAQDVSKCPKPQKPETDEDDEGDEQYLWYGKK